MKSLMVTDMVFHGGAVHASFLARELGRLSVDVEIFSYSSSHHPDIRIHTGPSLGVPSFHYKISLNKTGFFRLLRSMKPDVLHLHHCAGSLELAMDKIRSMGIPVVGTVHVSPSGQTLLDRVTNLYFNKFLSKKIVKADRVICVSKYVEEKVNASGIRSTVVIPNGIDPSVFYEVKDARKSLGIPEEDMVFLYVGRLSPEKGIINLLRAFKRLEIPNKRLYVIGSGILANLCRAYSKANNCVHYIGKVRESDLRLYYSAADATVVPSLWDEAFGMVLIESMACGTPPICTPKGAMPEIVRDGLTGFLCPGTSPRDVQETMTRASGSDLPRTGASGKEFVKSGFTWSQAARKTKKVYESAVL